MDANGWVLIIGAISLMACQVIGAIFAGLAWYKGHVAAMTAAQVKQDLAIADLKVDKVADSLIKAERESKERDTAIHEGVVDVKREINGKMAELLKEEKDRQLPLTPTEFDTPSSP